MIAATKEIQGSSPLTLVAGVILLDPRRVDVCKTLPSGGEGRGGCDPQTGGRGGGAMGAQAGQGSVVQRACGDPAAAPMSGWKGVRGASPTLASS